MDLEQARLILKGIRFLHFKYELKESSDSILFIIHVEAPDTQDRSKIISVMHQASVTPDYLLYMNEKTFIEFVFDRTICALRHEAGELFKVGDQDPFNEHEDGGHKWPMIEAMFKKPEHKLVMDKHMTPRPINCRILK